MHVLGVNKSSIFCHYFIMLSTLQTPIVYHEQLWFLNTNKYKIFFTRQFGFFPASIDHRKSETSIFRRFSYKSRDRSETQV